MTHLSNPIPAVGCICFRDDEVLLVRRGKAPRAGEWSIPGGRVEPGEPVRDAVLRELQEETGVTAELVALVDVVDAVFDSEEEVAFHYVLIDYVARWISGEPIAGDDAIDTRFVKLSALKAIELWDETRRVIIKGYEMIQQGNGEDC
ncbi:MAG: NUDIX hydrolase [Pseudomonadota bacterium]